MYICICKGVTDNQIKTAVEKGICKTVKDLRCHLGVASQCGKCGSDAKCLFKSINLQRNVGVSATPVTPQLGR